MAGKNELLAVQRKLQFAIALAQQYPESWEHLWYVDASDSQFHVNELIQDLYLSEEMGEADINFNKPQLYLVPRVFTMIV